MSEITVYYQAPIAVDVDVESGQILRVTVLDDALTLDSNYARNGSARDTQHAEDICENSDWPAWRIGA